MALRRFAFCLIFAFGSAVRVQKFDGKGSAFWYLAFLHLVI
jgi:hypothetical protein